MVFGVADCQNLGRWVKSRLDPLQIFGVIGGGAKLLKSYLYTGDPYNTVTKEAAQNAIPAPPGLGPVKDELIERTMDWYIDKYSLPNM